MERAQFIGLDGVVSTPNGRLTSPGLSNNVGTMSTRHLRTCGHPATDDDLGLPCEGETEPVCPDCWNDHIRTCPSPRCAALTD